MDIQGQRGVIMRLFLLLTALLHGSYSISLKGLFGEIVSPGFPNIYPNNVKESWNITVPLGHVVKLYFTHFSVEPSYLCEYDYIKIFSEGAEPATYCGETSTDTEEVPGDKVTYSTGNTMSVVFKSDYSNEKRFTGFRAFYVAEDIDECKMLNDGEPFCDHYCHNYIGGFYCTCRTGYILHENKKTCTVHCSGQVLTERSGEITSPDYPAVYPKLCNCDYRILVEEGFSIILEFVESFDVENHPQSQCPYDVLKIKTNKGEHGPFCGTKLPPRIETGSFKVDITFTSDISGSNKGWKIKYSVTAMPCPKPVAPPHGQISPAQQKYIFKDRFSISCDTGYEMMQGSSTLTSFTTECRKDGTWDKQPPLCEIVDCTDPDNADNATVEYITEVGVTTYKSAIRYKCEEPFYAMKEGSNAEYHCAASGHWVDSKGNRELPECEPICGEPTGRLTRVIGGQKAELGEFPWQVLVTVDGHIGGGSLLFDKWILTAAHVLSGHKDVSAIELKMGLIKRQSSEYVQVLPEKVFIHSKYKPDSQKSRYDNDIALIKLKHKVPISANVKPICLPGNDVRYNVESKTLGTVSGFGKTKQTSLAAEYLQFVEVEVIDHKQCKDVYDKLFPGLEQVTENMLCAGTEEGGKDACTGDSGGPYVFYDEKTHKWFIGGIVSWGEKCGVKDKYGVYTKVYNYISWIENTISTNF
ncbi:mannan-binding lectin serine protease 2 [Protopterus annectens]|uniref:mannan-binding lectin serine protease 2 n=1 Tax=Protopterus annectens TaxID=7888 RepID=UPI001CFB9CD8|nr:mannan-binding lectin serine protease 2 [Protopterus annectens]